VVRQFSSTKFCSLTRKKKEKKLLDILYEIEVLFEDAIKKNELVKKFKLCLGYCKNQYPFNTITFKNKREFIFAMSKIEDQLSIYKKDFEILKQDRRPNKIIKKTLVVVLDNLRSAFNIGSIIRSCECFGVKKIYFCGCSSTPENKKVQNTSMGCADHISWEYFSETKDAIKVIRNTGYKIFALETTSCAIELEQISPEGNIALLLGNEALGIEKENLLLCDKIIKIGLLGWKNSLNVGVCAGICLHHFV